MQLILLFTLLAIVFATKWHELDGYTFDDYHTEFRKVYHSKKEAFERQFIFESNLKEIRRHNQDPTQTWKKGVNQFTDRTPKELKAFLGSGVGSRKNTQHLSLNLRLKNSIDWRDYGIVSSPKNQGGCGSCWAFSAAQIVESYYALKTGHLEVLSEQQILDCTSNPNQCGGQGGCSGATEELAFEQIMAMGGLVTEWEYPYMSFYGQNFECNKSRTEFPVAQLSGYKVLPANNQEEIIHHLSNYGPLTASVDASLWFQYESGVYNGCNQTNPDLDHAINIVGFSDTFWTVRNSWGSLWGENGYIRIFKNEQPSCGVDLTPQHGSACIGDNSTQIVCGMCGILAESSYPIIKL